MLNWAFILLFHAVASVVAAANSSVVQPEHVLAAADSVVGKRYRYGGETTATGFDCSGLVQYVFGRLGMELPRTAAQMVSVGRPVPTELDSLRAGDLMFFSRRRKSIDHVAIYAGDLRVIHATRGGGGVAYDHLHSHRGEWFLKRFVAARRVLPDSMPPLFLAPIQVAEPGAGPVSQSN